MRPIRSGNAPDAARLSGFSNHYLHANKVDREPAQQAIIEALAAAFEAAEAARPFSAAECRGFEGQGEALSLADALALASRI